MQFLRLVLFASSPVHFGEHREDFSATTRMSNRPFEWDGDELFCIKRDNPFRTQERAAKRLSSRLECGYGWMSEAAAHLTGYLKGNW